MPGSPIAILGGTFDPPHLGHLVLAECARWQFGCARVLLMPAGDPYRKTGTDTAENRRASAPAPRQVTPAATRLEMVRLAIAGNPGLVADAREVQRPGPSYTVDTLEELRREGHAEIILVLGSDSVSDLPNWREPERIALLARIVVVEKEPGAGTGGFERVEMPLLRVSSTEVRARVAAGKPIRYLVPEAVRQFIERERLYR